MHHKRGRPKNRRAGCLLCKPHKANHAKGKDKVSTLRRTEDVMKWLRENSISSRELPAAPGWSDDAESENGEDNDPDVHDDQGI